MLGPTYRHAIGIPCWTVLAEDTKRDMITRHEVRNDETRTTGPAQLNFQLVERSIYIRSSNNGSEHVCSVSCCLLTDGVSVRGE